MQCLLILLIITTQSFAIQVKTWTMHELSHAVESKLKRPNLEDVETSVFPKFDSQTQPLVDALNQIMFSLFNGKNKDVTALMKSPSGSTLWTVEQLKEAMTDPSTNPDLVPFINQAFQQLINVNSNGKYVLQNTTEVEVPALDISVWTLSEVKAALANPETNTKVLPYLREAVEHMNSTPVETITLITPVGLIPNTNVYPTIVSRTID